MTAYRPSWLIKPTNACNFNCKYCYDKQSQADSGTIPMSMKTWEHIIKLINYEATIIFHGGEPLMVGVDWYREAFEIAKKYSSKVVFGMQTNGSLLNEDYLNLFKANNVSIGISYDFNMQSLQRGDDVLESIRLAKKLGVSAGCICVVTKANVDNLIEIFETSSNEMLGRGLSFNPVFKTQSALDNGIDVLSVDDIIYGFGRFFRYYKDRPIKDYFEKTAELYFSWIKEGKSNSCLYCDCRSHWVGVNANGDVYPCDRYYGSEYLYGNINDFKSHMDFMQTAGFSKYFRDVDKRYKNYCSKCPYFCLCNGGCNGSHLAGSGSLAIADSDFCNTVHAFYSMAKEVFGND